MRYVDPGLALLIEWTQEEANGGRFLFLLFLYFFILFVFFLSFSVFFFFHLRFDFVLVFGFILFFLLRHLFFSFGGGGRRGGENVPVNQRAVTMTFL